MKVQNIAKISPIIEMTSPVLLQCKSGECGNCPNNTGKLLWIPKIGNEEYITFNFQYSFFNKEAESTESIGYNHVSVFNTINGQPASYSNPPDKNYAYTNDVIGEQLPPSLMQGTDFLTYPFLTNGWIFFRQPNPAISNTHDALCFEYNHEKRLITFRSF